MEEEDVVLGQRTLRNGLNLCNVLVDEYHSHPESYKDVKIRFEDGTVLESSKLLLGSLSELLFESLESIPSWEEAEILVAPGIDSAGLRLFLEGVLGVSDASAKEQRLQTPEEEEQLLKEAIKTFGFDTPPRLATRLKAYYCEDCDVYTSKNEILSHVREAHPKGRNLFSSPIWSYFEATEHPDFHQCRECKNVIKDKSSHSSALISHLEDKHPFAHERFILQQISDQELVCNFFERSESRKRSPLQNYFTSLDLNNPDATACNLCLKVFRTHGESSILLRHLKLEHLELYLELSQNKSKATMCKSEPREELNDDGEEGSSKEDEDNSKKKNSMSIWNFFEKTDDPTVFACKECTKDIVIKEVPTSLSNLIKHLKTDHSDSYLQFSAATCGEDPKNVVPGLKTEPMEQGTGEEEEDYPMVTECLEEEEIENDISEVHSTVRRKKPSNLSGLYRCKLCPQEFKCSNDDLTLLDVHLKMAHPEVNGDFKERSKGEEYVLEEDADEEMIESSEREEGNAEDFNEELNILDEYFQSTEDDHALRECKSCLKVFREENLEGQLHHLKSEHQDIYADVMLHQESEKGDGDGTEGSCSLFDDSPTKYKKRSLIWNYFKSTDVPFMNACKYCSKVFKCKGQTTSSMIRHLKIEHLEVFEEFSALTASINGRKIGESPRKYFIPLETGDKDVIPSDEEEPQNNLSTSEIVQPLEETSHNGDNLLPLSSGENNAGMKGNKRRSSIWNYFVGTEEHEMNACRVCNRIFKCKGQTTSSMIRHLKKEHVELFNEFLCTKDRPRDPIEVSLSIKKEKKRSPIWNYYDKTDNPGTNECRTCKKQFKCKGQSTFNMIRHLESNHPSIYQTFLSEGGRAGGEETQICAECGKQFTNRSALTQHMKVSHASSCPYKCEICNATFTRRESYEQHSHDKNKPRNFLCTICGKTFGRRSIRDFHEKAHDAEKKYQCSYCPKKFLTNQRKYKHERTHTGEKPYQCTDCGRQFTLSHHLVTHSRIHTGQKPYSCDFCPQTFRHLSSRNNHKCEGKLRLNPQS